jgi:putative membrane protein
MFLFFGIVFSLLFLSKAVYFLLNYNLSRICLYGFFSGATIASLFFLMKSIKKHNFFSAIYFIAGLTISISFMFFKKTSLFASSDLMLIIAGFFAMIAMLLPGISGSFVFLVLGVYPKIIGALSSIYLVSSVKTLFFVFLGILTAVLTFPKIIFYALEKNYNLAISFLVGLMLGSITSLWPFAKGHMPSWFSLDLLSFALFLLLSFLLFFKLKQNFEEKTV